MNVYEAAGIIFFLWFLYMAFLLWWVHPKKPKEIKWAHEVANERIVTIEKDRKSRSSGTLERRNKDERLN